MARMLSASSMRNQKVVNREEEALGHIVDVMLNLETGSIGYVVLSFGGILGIGDKLFAVPFSALTPDAENCRFSLDVSKEELETAPGFDKNNWPTILDRDFERNIHRHYGLTAPG